MAEQRTITVRVAYSRLWKQSPEFWHFCLSPDLLGQFCCTVQHIYSCKQLNRHHYDITAPQKDRKPHFCWQEFNGDSSKPIDFPDILHTNRDINS
jgi:hypothetical protein